jgi:hypothetical protein
VPVEQVEPRHQQMTEDDYPDEPSVADRRRTAAPVSRSAPGVGGGNSNRVVLTEQQREMARLSGVSELDYARGVLRLQHEKRIGLRQ